MNNNYYQTPDVGLKWKDQQIISKITDDLPKEFLEVGGGNGVLSFHLNDKGYDCTVTDTDDAYAESWKMLNAKGIKTQISNILDLKTFDKDTYCIVSCSQVLEHIPDYQQAFKNLLQLTSNKLIITVPWKRSFLDPGHVNFWDDQKTSEFEDIRIFRHLAEPRKTMFERIYTKQQDMTTGQMNYLITVTN